jgi:hypothetical protein
MLDEAMDRLSPRERDAILLRFYEGRTVGQIAAGLGIDRRAAAQRVTRGLAKLRAYFQSRRVEWAGELSVAAILGELRLRQAPEPMVHAILNSAVGTSTSTGATLAQAALRTMSLAKMKVAAVILVGTLAVGAIVAGAVLRVATAAPPADHPAGPAAANEGVATASPAVRVQDITFEPIGSGKNIVHVMVRSTSTENRWVRVAVIARSGDRRSEWKGWSGVGFPEYRNGQYIAQSHPPNLPARQQVDIRYVFQIPEPYSPAASITVQLFDQGASTPIHTRQFEAGRLAQRKIDWAHLPEADDDQVQSAKDTLAEVQLRMRLGLYGRARELFSSDWQEAEQAPVREWFRKRVYSAKPDWHTWDAASVLQFQPRDVRRAAAGTGLVLMVNDGDRARPIELVQENGQWRIDWIHKPMEVAP